MIKPGTLWKLDNHEGHFLYLETEENDDKYYPYMHWFITPDGRRRYLISNQTLKKTVGIVQVK